MIIGMITFYILRIIFNVLEFNYMALILAVCALAIVITDNTIAGKDLVFYVVPTFYVIAMSVINMGFVKVGGRK